MVASFRQERRLLSFLLSAMQGIFWGIGCCDWHHVMSGQWQGNN